MPVPGSKKFAERALVSFAPITSPPFPLLGQSRGIGIQVGRANAVDGNNDGREVATFAGADPHVSGVRAYLMTDLAALRVHVLQQLALALIEAEAAIRCIHLLGCEDAVVVGIDRSEPSCTELLRRYCHAAQVNRMLMTVVNGISHWIKRHHERNAGSQN